MTIFVTLNCWSNNIFQSVSNQNELRTTYQWNLFHGVPPGFVNSCETAPLLRHLSHDVWGAEYGLQVEPGGLHLQPFVQDLLEEQQFSLPFPRGGYEYM